MLRKSALFLGCSIAIFSSVQNVQAAGGNTIEMTAVVGTSCSVELEGYNYVSWSIDTKMSDEQLAELKRQPFVLKFDSCQTGTEFSLFSKDPVDDFCTKATPLYPDRPEVDAGSLKFCFDDESHNGINVTTATKSNSKITNYSQFNSKEDDSTVTIYAYPQFGDTKATQGTYYGEVTVMVKVE